jgi:hypothetical protein
MAMHEPLNELLAELRAAIDEAEQTGNREELARLVDELDRRLNEDDDEGVVDDLRDAGPPTPSAPSGCRAQPASKNGARPWGGSSGDQRRPSFSWTHVPGWRFWPEIRSGSHQISR